MPAKSPSDEETREHVDLIIELPDDPTRVKQLKMKLEEYRGRLDPYHHPELSHMVNPGAIYKIMILEELLKEGKVSSYDMSRKVVERFGSFYEDAFNSACGVINDYITTGGKNVNGGTGLPKG